MARYRSLDHADAEGADWTDLERTSLDWVAESLDLGGWAGRRARVRFRRILSSGSVALGWTVEGIRLGPPPSSSWWVDPDGSDVFGCGHPERPLGTVAAALDLSAAGDTLRLTEGSHVAASIRFVEGRERPVLLPLPPGRMVRGDGRGRTFLESGPLGVGVWTSPDTGWSPTDSAHVAALTLVGGARGARVEEGALLLEDVDLREAGTGVVVDGGRLHLRGGLITACGRAARQGGGDLRLERCTVVDQELGLFVASGAATTRIDASIFARMDGTLMEVQDGAPAPVIACTDFWGFGGNPALFVGMEDPRGQAGNLQVDPLFCDAPGGDYALASLSPLLDSVGCGAVGAFGEGCSVPAVAAPAVARPRCVLQRVWPNPFNPRATILFTTARDGRVALGVFDARGRRVRSLVDGFRPAGTHRVVWDGTDESGCLVAGGVYRLRLDADGAVDARPVVLLK
jgi:hypothetical protein